MTEIYPAIRNGNITYTFKPDRYWAWYVYFHNYMPYHYQGNRNRNRKTPKTGR